MATPDKSKWYCTHIDPWWNDYQTLDYINEPFNDDVSLDTWKRLGYTQTRFTGDMYDMRNPAPEWVEGFRNIFPWKHFSWSIYRMGPGTVLPNHRDLYVRFREIYNVNDLDSIWRSVVFLENWQSGHYFEIDNCPITNWIAGDCVVWQNDVEHLAANMGMTDRYTLQITGVVES